MIWFEIIALLLYGGCTIALIQLLVMAIQKFKHPDRIKDIYRIFRWLNYQMWGCGVLLGFIVKLGWF